MIVYGDPDKYPFYYLNPVTWSKDDSEQEPERCDCCLEQKPDDELNDAIITGFRSIDVYSPIVSYQFNGKVCDECIAGEPRDNGTPTFWKLL